MYSVFARPHRAIRQSGSSICQHGPAKLSSLCKAEKHLHSDPKPAQSMHKDRSAEPGISRTRRRAQLRTRVPLPRRAGQPPRGVGAVADRFLRRATAVTTAARGVCGRAELSRGRWPVERPWSDSTQSRRWRTRRPRNPRPRGTTRQPILSPPQAGRQTRQAEKHHLNVCQSAYCRRPSLRLRGHS